VEALVADLGEFRQRLAAYVHLEAEVMFPRVRELLRQGAAASEVRTRG
jgi:hypothetical protein